LEVSAAVKHVGISPKKARPVVDVVRGKKVNEALVILQFSPTPAARLVAKVIKSASANAENNFEMSPSELKITKIYVEKVPRPSPWASKPDSQAFQPHNRGS
jgi:large subunit ribosomal protein L22